MTITNLPKDEVERVLALQEIVMKGGQRGIAARFMKDAAPAMFRILQEEFERDHNECLIGFMSFQVNMVSNLIENTFLSRDSDGSFNMIKELFCAMVDETAEDFRNRRKTN